MSFIRQFSLRVFRSWIIRIVLILVAAVYLAYTYWALPHVNRMVSAQYLQQTGHALQHEPLQIQLAACSISLNNIRDSKNLWQAASVHIDVSCKESFHQRALIINAISIDGFKTTLHQSEDGQWNFDDIVQHLHKTQSPKPEKSAAQNAPLYVKKITLNQAEVRTNLLALNNVDVDASPLTLTLENIDLRKNSSTAINLHSNINKTIPLTVVAHLNITSLTGDVDINAEHIPATWFNPALKPYVALEVLAGELSVHNHILLNTGLPQKIISSGSIDNLQLRPTTMEQDAVKWKNLIWTDAEIGLNEKVFHLPLLTLNGLDGQFIIAKDRTTNVQAMIIKPVAGTPQSTAKIEASSPWQFSIDRIAINNAAVGFNDQSLKPSFTAIVQQFTGEITNISSDATKTTEFQLAGNVDGYAPVNLQGNAKPFLAKPQMEALFTFKHIDMGALTPYSAEYAGWRIKKGLLSVDLHYHYDQGKILGKNHVVIDHLEFGEKVRSTHIIDIPLRLGLSLLTDEKGIAILDAEVTGDPQDPSFSIRDILWRALRNTFKKILLSPFHFLSALLNTTEDLGSVQFTAGESQLTDATIKKLTLLHDAFKKRPKMRLSIHGTFDEVADYRALQEEQVKSALQKSGVNPEAIKSKSDAWVQAINIRYATLPSANPALTPEEKFRELALQETVDTERLNKLAHERGQAVKQYFVLQLGDASENLLLDSENRCDKTHKCNASEVQFTLEE